MHNPQSLILAKLKQCDVNNDKLNSDFVSRQPSLVPRLSVGVSSMCCNEDTADARKSLKVSAVLKKIATHYYITRLWCQH